MPASGDATSHRRSPRRRRVLLGLLPLTLLAAGCASDASWPGFFPPDSVTRQGESTLDLYLITFVVAAIVFFLVEGLLIAIALRWRHRASDVGLPNQTHGSNPMEILWTIVPAITVTALFIGVIATLAEHYERLEPNPPVVVDVTGFQWQWTFDYPNEGLSFTGAGAQGPLMAVPVNETVRIRLHAQDVIHSFYVPQFLYKKDVIPGRVNEFDVVVQEPGTYTGQCAEFCGLSHYEMFFTVQAMSRADYDAWVIEQQQAPEPTNTPPPDAFTVEVTSVSVADGFDPEALSVPADTAWVVQLTNADPNVPHDFAVRGAGPDGGDWQGDPDAPGGGSASYVPPPLAAGTYEFYCSLHPNMVGTLNVGE